VLDFLEGRGIFSSLVRILAVAGGKTAAVVHKHISSKSSPITGLDRPRGFQEVKVPRFRDMMVVGCQPYAPAAFTPRKSS